MKMQRKCEHEENFCLVETNLLRFNEAVRQIVNKALTEGKEGTFDRFSSFPSTFPPFFDGTLKGSFCEFYSNVLRGGCFMQ